MPLALPLRRQCYEIRGVVQGVGFRPFVYTLAVRNRLTGHVRNHSSGVAIEVEGSSEQLADFSVGLRDELPPLAQIDAVRVVEAPPQHDATFRILPSQFVAEASTAVSPDVAACELCIEELRDPANRRHRYPFINCTHCGPRFTIIRDLPYDRPQTTMCVFPMCSLCKAEYHDPADRRYHAQPNACPRCGPAIWFVRAGQVDARATTAPGQHPSGDEALAAFHRSIAADEIVAVKGIGGFHLASNASSSPAVSKLRQRKGRSDKPLAIMVADLSVARRLAEVDDDEARLLTSRQRPIVLLRRRPATNLSTLLAPGNDSIGVMLPYSPLHALLVERQPLVMTSGNRSEEPIVRTNREAAARLDCLADAFLLHNREIHVACDDSVVRIAAGKELPIRRSRGYAPLPVRLPHAVPNCLAVGGELKSTFCLTRGKDALLSPHLGDMGNLETLDAFRRTVDHLMRLFRVTPEAIACDMHPGYLSSQWARDYAREHQLRLIEVQHHHAHLAGALAEHGRAATAEAIGICFDGTGYGTDGAVWGGEAFCVAGGEYQRVAHLRYIRLPGGDAAVRSPARTALAHLWAAGLAWDDRLPPTQCYSTAERKILRQQLERGLVCTDASSVGRLFDAVAALAGIRQQVAYEAQAAIEMEALVGDIETAQPYPLAWHDGPPLEIDPAPMLRAIVAQVCRGETAATIATRFHRTMVELVATLCQRLRKSTGLATVVLSGGVFQNRPLAEGVVRRLAEAKFDVLTHQVVPPNDGGLALGQAVIAANRLDRDAATTAAAVER